MNIHTTILAELTPATARFIRLGPGGAWASACIENAEIRFGSPTEPHQECLAGDWDAARTALIGQGKSTGEASQCLREIREFYTLPAEDCLWITFHEGRLWWTFAEPEVSPVPDAGPGVVLRRSRGGWLDTSRLGVPLLTDALSSRLTQVRSYQRSICKVGELDYLLRKINGLEEPAVARTRIALAELAACVEVLIAGLHWADFEVFADLLLARSGWQRVSALGKAQPDLDLVVEQPGTGERGFVQVKSRATQGTLEASIAAYRASGAYARMFFICHSPSGELGTEAADVGIWSGAELAHRAVAAGLLGWLIERAG